MRMHGPVPPPGGNLICGVPHQLPASGFLVTVLGRGGGVTVVPVASPRGCNASQLGADAPYGCALCNKNYSLRPQAFTPGLSLGALEITGHSVILSSLTERWSQWQVFPLKLRIGRYALGMWDSPPSFHDELSLNSVKRSVLICVHSHRSWKPL